MKIVVLDGYTLNPGDLSWKELENIGECRVYDRTSYIDIREVAEKIGDAEIIFTNKTPITKDVIDKCNNLRYIGVLATGYNVVDIKAAIKKGIVVTNIPAYGTRAVGQSAIALLLEICNHVGHHDKAVKEGRWTNNIEWCFWDYPLIELSDKVMGIIGFGRIGQSTGKIAKALGMKIIANDQYENESGREIGEYVSLEEIFEKSDIISLHCPLLDSTQGIINKLSIAKMKNGVIIINNSRGALIVEADLAEALNSGKVYAAGLDVVCKEPIEADNPLLKANNCIITPHIAWAPKETRDRLLGIAINNLKNFLNGNPVNIIKE
ncbi:D-2-hydroxyacid dehydrogenase [Fusobacterium sp. PH5-44]|uniref:D-2-hydroxyacid dehydrogenase n=1 Tax=unclassified Fusobacterium TaxID=2648384 RepID=UPI003D222C5B